jgi:predicted DNA-binding transcriptional regulator AlpA
MASLTIGQWCDAHGFSRSYFYLLEKRGEAPRTYRIGKFRRISDEANCEWVAAREAASA